MSGIKKERTPEQIEAAKARMAAVRAKKGSKPKVHPEMQELADAGAFDVPKKWAKPKYGVSPLISSGVMEEMKKDNAAALEKLKEVEHKRSKSIPDEFEGITAKDCCDSCYASKGERCAITHRGLCGHPMKGGLQQPDQMNPATVARYMKAKKILAHAKIEAA